MFLENVWAVGLCVICLLGHFWTFLPSTLIFGPMQVPTLNRPMWIRWPGLISSERAFPPSADDEYRLSRTVTSTLTFMEMPSSSFSFRPSWKEKAAVLKVTKVSSHHSQRVCNSFDGLLTEISFTFFMDGWLIRCRLIDFQPFHWDANRLSISQNNDHYHYHNDDDDSLFHPQWMFISISSALFNKKNKPRLEIISPSWWGCHQPYASYTPLPSIITSIPGAGWSSSTAIRTFKTQKHERRRPIGLCLMFKSISFQVSINAVL